jgi:hypothetical protein
MVQLNQTGRVVTLVAVSQGNVYSANSGDSSWTEATNSTTGPINPPLTTIFPIFSAANNQILYFADGSQNYTQYDPSTNTVATWTASAGSLPVGTDGGTARLICTWRGRTCLAGLITDPQDWFMSAISDPTNWDTSPLFQTTSQAIDGESAPQGLIGDIVTALIPYTDDLLVFGCDHTIYMMQGDPLGGGNISLVSDKIGIAFGQAWVKDPYGNLYFMSNRCGVYSFVPGQQPQRISQGIEQLLLAIDTGLNSIRMEWDDVFQGFWIFVTPTAAATVTTHFFYEVRTGAWWTNTFNNNNHNPVATVQFDGNTPSDRVVCLGSWDGVVRFLDRNALDDDRRPIFSSVLFGPILTDKQDVMMLKNLQAILGNDSGNVTYSILLGTTAEQASQMTAVPQLQGTFSAGANLTGLVQRSAKAIYVRFDANNAWRMEQMRGYIATQGRIRQRGLQ